MVATSTIQKLNYSIDEIFISNVNLGKYRFALVRWAFSMFFMSVTAI